VATGNHPRGPPVERPMRAIRIEQHGGPEVLVPAEVEAPRPGPGQLLVAVAAAGVNYIDTYQRSGAYPIPVPFVPGLEGAGAVAAVGEGVEGFRAGDRVAWAAAPGSYAEQVLVAAERAVPVPDGVADEVAAAAMLQGCTAQYLCSSTYPVQLRGGRVIGTVSTDEKAALARQAGADEVIRYDQVDFAAETRRLTDGRGVAAVYDGVGRTTFDGGLAVLKPRGSLVLYGAASGPVPPVDPQRLNSGGSLFLTRPSLAHYTLTREELLARAGAVLDWILSGQLDVRIGGRYPLAEARRAHEDLQGRRTTGKLLMLP